MPGKKKVAVPARRRPEAVYKVVKKPVISTKTGKKAPKRKKKRITLHTTVPRPVAIASLVLLVCIVIGGIMVATHRIDHMITDTRATTAQLGYSKDMIKKMSLMGNDANYPNEIINFQSAPADLQEFVLRDYKAHKSQCIVNGTFAGPLRYEIVNIVYDTYARIEKECAGTDTLIVKKMSGVWTAVFSGNDWLECDDVNAFDVPQGIAYYCREGTVTYTNPNP